METFDPLMPTLATEVKSYGGDDLERSCWLVVHRHTHGVLPSEYDIREIPEDLYLKLLVYCRESNIQ